MMKWGSVSDRRALKLLDQFIERATGDLLCEIREVELAGYKPWLSKHRRNNFVEDEEMYWQRLEGEVEVRRAGLRQLKAMRQQLVDSLQEKVQ